MSKLTGYAPPHVVEKMRKKGMVTSLEAAAIAGIRQTSVANICRTASLGFRCERIGKHWFVHIESFKRFRGIE